MTDPCILIYGDSLSWGIIPGSRNRYRYSDRWPGILQTLLKGRFRVIEECLNGRTTHLEDPVRSCRNGLKYLSMVIESHSPVGQVVVFLGVNDFLSHFTVDAAQSAAGLAKLAQAILAIKPEPLGVPPELLVLIPPAIIDPKGEMAEKFFGFETKVRGMTDRYRKSLRSLGIPHLDLNRHLALSRVDGVHLDPDSHKRIAHLVAGWINSRFQSVD